MKGSKSYFKYDVTFNDDEVDAIANRISYRRVFLTEGMPKNELFANVDKFYLNIVA